MTRRRTLLLVVLGIAVPAALVAGVYLASAGPLTDVPAVVAVPADKVAAPMPTVSETTTSGNRGGANDRSGKCDEKEHELDPECDPRGGGGGGGDDGSGARTGGSGSDDSGGHGSDGDSSGHGSDGDSSGHGSGGDD